MMHLKAPILAGLLALFCAAAQTSDQVDILSDGNAPTTNAALFSETATSAVLSRRITHNSYPGGGHANVMWTGNSVELNAVGSGVNGPRSADVGQTISVIKHNYTTSSTKGELDGQYIVIRQGGADSDGTNGNNSDGSGMLIDASSVGKVGFLAGSEIAVENVDRGTFATTRRLDLQLGVVNRSTVAYHSYGLVLGSQIGANGTGLLIHENGGTFDKFIDVAGSTGTVFEVNKKAVWAPTLVGYYASAVIGNWVIKQDGTGKLIAHNNRTGHDTVLANP